MRKLSENEKNLISSFAQKLPIKEKEQLLADASNAMAKEINSDGSIVRFEISGYQRPPNSGQHQFGVEGKMFDSDNVNLSVFLYADRDNRLLELELMRLDTNYIVIAPQWNTLSVFELTPLTRDSKGNKLPG